MCHVLIIEDERLIALDMADVLTDHGASSFSFADNEGDAIDAADQRVPDFIVSDVCLRSGTGPQAVAQIRAKHGTIPVIFVTATPDADFQRDPPSNVFRKPMDRRAIGATFHTMAFG